MLTFLSRLYPLSFNSHCLVQTVMPIGVRSTSRADRTVLSSPHCFPCLVSPRLFGSPLRSIPAATTVANETLLIHLHVVLIEACKDESLSCPSTVRRSASYFDRGPDERYQYAVRKMMLVTPFVILLTLLNANSFSYNKFFSCETGSIPAFLNRPHPEG